MSNISGSANHILLTVTGRAANTSGESSITMSSCSSLAREAFQSGAVVFSGAICSWVNLILSFFSSFNVLSRSVSSRYVKMCTSWSAFNRQSVINEKKSGTSVIVSSRSIPIFISFPSLHFYLATMEKQDLV